MHKKGDLVMPLDAADANIDGHGPTYAQWCAELDTILPPSVTLCRAIVGATRTYARSTGLEVFERKYATDATVVYRSDTTPLTLGWLRHVENQRRV